MSSTRPFWLCAIAALFGGCITVVVEDPSSRPDVPALEGGDRPVLDVVVLDAREPRGAQSRVVLEDGVAYEVTASGTYSAWAPSFWRRGVCAGTPERSAAGPVGFDASYAFAVPHGSRNCGRPTPERQSGWYVALERRGDYVAGATDAPYDPGHVYRRVVHGRGERLRAHVYDSPGDYGDNYGAIRLEIRRAE